MKIGITCYPTYGGSGAVATELGLDLVHVHCAIPHATSVERFSNEKILPLYEALYRDVVGGA